MIITLKINKDKLRRFLQNPKARITPSGSQTPGTPSINRAPSSMPPPSTPASNNQMLPKAGTPAAPQALLGGVSAPNPVEGQPPPPPAKAASTKAPTQTKITSLLEKVVKSYDCSLVESTTSWLFDRNEIEGTKKIVLAPGEGSKGEGVPELGEVWGVETGVSLGSGKVKQYENRTTLHRRTLQTYGLKRPTSRKILSEVVKKFGVFPFSLRQLEDERDAKTGVVECVRSNVFRQYEVVGDKDNSPVG
ncbi:hypothetical protein BN1708_016596, partial [Verticillium longisporum]